ncbi:CIS tube protein [Rubrivivax rivuli]|uniref:Contractile injection system tube protein N-terminal domain-containing protein n=1 Tax=Rubrivivax rivuli TaxID=1862385 RepID=A0A437RHH2_9BURK|nr:hypothetical protein [Rubrivivax rivuli]RVU46216.1 hypothetical protein EOE66_10185 [Rubrivivax rivuli]
MAELAKATLTELNASNQPVGQGNPVQFNPASMRLQFSNRSTGGAQAGAPTRQQAGEGSVTLSFDLHFDSADEGTADAPVSVLRKTAAVQRYVRPRGNRPGEEAPPRVQFEWGAVKLQGVMDSLSLDIELFAFDGTPLRARCAVSMKGQDAAYALAPQGTGAGSALRAAAEGLLNSTAGQAAQRVAPFGTTQALNAALAGAESVVRALEGESLAQLSARTGRDPAAWRSLGAGNADPLALRAGQEVPLPRGSGAAPAGNGAGGGALASGGLAALRSSGGTAVAESSPAALTRAGGVAAAQGQQREARHEGGASAALRGFGLTARAPAGGATAAPAAASARGGLQTGSTGPGGLAPADDRPYGFGLPLKPRRAVAPASAPAAAGRRSASASPCGCGGASRPWRSACGCGR